jgi:hypothetical protein
MALGRRWFIVALITLLVTPNSSIIQAFISPQSRKEKGKETKRPWMK